MARPAGEAEHRQHHQHLQLLLLERGEGGLQLLLLGVVQEAVGARPAVAAGCFSGPAWLPTDSSEPPSVVGKSAAAGVVVVAGQPVVVGVVVAVVVGHLELPG